MTVLLGAGPAKYLLIALHLVIALTAASHALLHKRDPRAAWGWIAACWLFPLAGAFLYYIFGVNRVHEKARRLLGTPPALGVGEDAAAPRLPAIAGADAAELRELVRIGAAMTRLPLCFGNRVEALHNGEQAYPAMLAAIAGARDSIYLCTYIFEDGKVAEEFIEALVAAEQRGVQVRVLVDGISAVLYATPAWKRLKAAAPAKTRVIARFLPPHLIPPMLHLNLRNHRKLLVIDSKLAFTGGMNIRDVHLLSPPRKHTVADMNFRVGGPVVGQLEDTFIHDWQFVTGEKLPKPTTVSAAAGESACRVVTEGPDEEVDKLILVLLGAIASAHQRVWIMTPYFGPGAVLVAALQSAALRGVDVNIILPAHSDQRYMDLAARKYLEQLLPRRVQVWYQPAPFAHTKLFVVDGYYAQVGSANMDLRSMQLNFELMLEVYDADFVAGLVEHFETVRARSVRLTLEHLAARSLPERLRDAFCWLFSPYL